MFLLLLLLFLSLLLSFTLLLLDYSGGGGYFDIERMKLPPWCPLCWSSTTYWPLTYSSALPFGWRYPIHRHTGQCATTVSGYTRATPCSWCASCASWWSPTSWWWPTSGGTWCPAWTCAIPACCTCTPRCSSSAPCCRSSASWALGPSASGCSTSTGCCCSASWSATPFWASTGCIGTTRWWPGWNRRSGTGWPWTMATIGSSRPSGTTYSATTSVAASTGRRTFSTSPCKSAVSVSYYFSLFLTGIHHVHWVRHLGVEPDIYVHRTVEAKGSTPNAGYDLIYYSYINYHIIHSYTSYVVNNIIWLGILRRNIKKIISLENL